MEPPPTKPKGTKETKREERMLDNNSNSTNGEIVSFGQPSEEQMRSGDDHNNMGLIPSETSPSTQTSDPMNSTPTLKDAHDYKEKGNTQFKSGEPALAAESYEMGLKIIALLRLQPSEEEEKKRGAEVCEDDFSGLEVMLRSNRACVLLKMERNGEAEVECLKALELNPGLEKAWYRLAQAHESLGNLSAAESDLIRCLDLLKSNEKSGSKSMVRDATAALVRVRRRIRDDTSQNSGPEKSVCLNLNSVAVACDNDDITSEETQLSPDVCAPVRSTPTQSQNVSKPNSKQIPSPHRQKEDILQLLAQSNQTGPLHGEAYFFINFSWWRRWCRHVDFFYESRFGLKLSQEEELMVEKRRKEVLSLMPPGASMPELKRKKVKRESDSDSSSSDSSSESDEESDEGGWGPRPGAIDNSQLILPVGSCRKSVEAMAAQDLFYNEWRRPYSRRLDENDSTQSSILLRPNLVRGHHYEVLPREAYAALRCWYGEISESLCRRANGSQQQPLLLLYAELRRVCGTTELDGHSCGACRTKGARSRCTRCFSVYYCGRGCQTSHWVYHKSACKVLAKRNQNGDSVPSSISSEEDAKWGRTGLNNLGNTCFMNSALQCLSHSSPLTKHFLTFRFKADLNVSNPLGTGGRLAQAYNDLLKDLYLGAQHRGVRSISPTTLKRAIARFAPRFAGVSQHDAMEFLAYLLDGLHEDLNRRKDKVYVEMPDVAMGQRLSIAGAEAWDAHCRRNDSLVMDTFYGQFKSTCVCPRCDRVSVSFDAFNHISLEIPQSTTRVIPILVFKAAKKNVDCRPLRYGLTLPKTGFVCDLKKALSEASGIPLERLFICDIYEGSIYEVLQDNCSLHNIKQSDVIAAYEVDLQGGRKIHSLSAHVPFGSSQTPDGNKNIGFPLLAIFPVTFTCRQVWNHIWKHVRWTVDHGDIKVEKRRSLLLIRIIDGNGKPRPLFNDVLDVGFGRQLSKEDSLSVLPRQSDSRISQYLGPDCLTQYLSLSLEWIDAEDETNKPLNLVDESKFLAFSDHPTLLEANQRDRANDTRNGVSLDRCFATFTRPERLDENNKWFCSNCKEHVRAMKTMELWRLPNVLVLHLKRFEFRHALRRDKLETFVDFPLEGLDMNRFCASARSRVLSQDIDTSKATETFDLVQDEVPAIYDLFGVINHYGRMGFGHYTAFARRWNETHMDEDWALFDDDAVRNLGCGMGRGGSLIVTPAAYVLFYRRRIFS